MNKKAQIQKPLLPDTMNDNTERRVMFNSSNASATYSWDTLATRSAGKSLLRADTAHLRKNSHRDINRRTMSFSISKDSINENVEKLDTNNPGNRFAGGSSPDNSRNLFPISSQTSSGSTSSSGMRGRKVLKDIGLGSTFWPGIKHLRKVFRNIFDVEGKGEINQTQFRHGLKIMEFDVSNPEALNALFREVDKDHNGLISEGAFLEVFRNMNRKKLAKKLALESKYIKNNPVRRTTKAINSPSERRLQTIVIDIGKHRKGGKFRKYLVEPENISKKLTEIPHWRAHIRWIDLTGYDETAMELIATILKLPVAILEDIEFEQRAKVEFYENLNIMQIVTHAITLQNCPIRRREEEVSLQSSKAFRKKRPKTADVQIHIFIIQDHTIVTYRKYHELAILNNIWEDIVPQLRVHANSVQGPFLLTARSLATEILDEIAEHNWVARDQFKDWKIHLEKAIMKNTSPTHLKHILDMKHCSLVATNIFRPNAQMMDFLTASKYIDTPRVRFISSYLDDYRDVFESFTRLKDEIEFTYTACGQLNEFYKSSQADKMNRILYVLTVVTAIISPIQLVTGIYGMNFDVMPDLDWKYSYLIFWVCSILLVSGILILARHKRLL